MGKSSSKIKKPLLKGVAKVPVVMQMEDLECGAASLTMILAYYRKWLPLEQVRADCGVSRDGSNARNVLKAARSYGLIAKGYRYEPEDLKKNGKFPCIIHWNFNHFLVLNGFRNDKAYLNDPAKGSYSVSMEEFDRSFTGICMMFEPDENFEPGGKPKSMLSFARKRLVGAGIAVAFLVLTSVISSLLGVIQPVFSRIFMDRLLTGQNPDWLYPFIFALALFSAVQIIIAWIQAVWSLKIDGKLAVTGSAVFMWKVLRMPMEFFSQRMAGDILQRQGSNAAIAGTLVNTFAPLALSAIMMVFYLVLMIRYSPLLTLVGLGSIVVNMLVARFISAKRVNITRVQMRDSGKLSSATVAGIGMIETIKASGAENGYFEKWSGYQASVNTQKVRFQRLNQYMGMIPGIVTEITNTAILALGIWLTMCGQFTAGMIMAFQGFMTSFSAPAQSLIAAGQMLQEMRTEMERVEDVMEYPMDEEAPESDTQDTYDKLSGRLEMKHVTFGYSRLGEPLIEDFSMSLEPGSRVIKAL